MKNGIEWNGTECTEMERNGWNRMEMNGNEWKGVKRYGNEWNGKEWIGMECIVEWRGNKKNGMETNGMLQNRTEWTKKEWNERNRVWVSTYPYSRCRARPDTPDSAAAVDCPECRSLWYWEGSGTRHGRGCRWRSGPRGTDRARTWQPRGTWSIAARRRWWASTESEDCLAAGSTLQPQPQYSTYKK